MTKDGPPMLNPSSAPVDATDTEDSTKPRLMMRRAAAPREMVSAFSVNRPMSWPGSAQHRAVPRTMMPAMRAREVV